MSSDELSQERLHELEIRVAFQEETIEQLNTALSDQQLQIGRLEETCKALVQRFRSLQDSLDELSGDDAEIAQERPPHY